MKEPSAGQQQQLENMDPRKRMEVYAHEQFDGWLTQQERRPTDSLTKLKMKHAFIGGFLAGMDRTMEAIYRPKPWWKSEIVFHTGTFVLGVALGFAFFIAAVSVPLGQ